MGVKGQPWTQDELARSFAPGEKPQIERSWQRLRACAVGPDLRPPNEYTEFDPEARLLRLAAPVLSRLADEVSNVEMAVILTDPRGLVLERRASRAVMRTLDQVVLAPGYLYSEKAVGTNAIGTAAADQGSAWVVGSEHYVEWLRELSCAGAVIRSPTSGRVEGVIDLTCYVKNTNPLMMPLVKQAAREIEQRLYDDTPPATREIAAAIRKAEAKAVGEERRRLARELHDSVSQVLFGIKMEVDKARGLLGKPPDEMADGMAEPLEYLRELTATGIADVRALMGELRSGALGKEGLVAALRKQIAAVETHHGLPVEGHFPEREPVASLEAKEALFRICQEALHNVVKHARAKGARVRLQREGAFLVVEISDDGIGFDTKRDFPGHFGLRSMRERAARAGGDLEVYAGPGGGTRVVARVPVKGAS